MKAVGTNTDDRTNAIPMTGPDSSSIAFRAASFGARPSSIVALHAFDDHNGVIHHQADGEHQAEHGKRVNGEAKEREEDERAHQ